MRVKTHRKGADRLPICMAKWQCHCAGDVGAWARVAASLGPGPRRRRDDRARGLAEPFRSGAHGGLCADVLCARLSPEPGCALRMCPCGYELTTTIDVSFSHL